MVAISHEEIERLELEQAYRENCLSTGVSWEHAFERLSNTRWFRRQLKRSSQRIGQKTRLPVDRLADLRQEALVLFARSMQRDITLGFDGQRGSLASLLAVIIYRCCCKSLSQFRHPMTNLPFNREADHPHDTQAENIENKIDLHECVNRLHEPFRQTIKLMLANHSIKEIAILTKCSQRTVYRRRDHAFDILRKQLDESAA